MDDKTFIEIIKSVKLLSRQQRNVLQSELIKQNVSKESENRMKDSFMNKIERSYLEKMEFE